MVFGFFFLTKSDWNYDHLLKSAPLYNWLVGLYV